MSKHIAITLTAPSHWAGYLMNGDTSGLSAADIAACDRWRARENVPLPVSCEDAGFHRFHDACAFADAADCQDYTFLIPAFVA